jgi:formylglycine-generating enzyme required for sulfatase activity
MSIAVACSVAEQSGPPSIGDPNPNGKTPGSVCTAADECRSGVCAAGSCQGSTATDGVKNGDETDIDCGGTAGPRCTSGKACATNDNCRTGLCTEYRCAVADGTPSDGKQSGHETDVDCGGSDVDVVRCENGKKCEQASDCTSAKCFRGFCRPPTVDDGVLNGDETDVDCGGTNPQKCLTDKSCQVGADCRDKICEDATKKCKAPALDDGVMNGEETGVDCGGPAPAKRCGVGEGCVAHSDCSTNACSYDKTCAIAPSCTALAGGQTCGPMDGMGKQRDCCERAQVGPYTVDKYLITAGRMRAFVTRLDGKIRDFAAALPANQWNQAWTAELPNAIDGRPGDPGNVNTQLGPFYGKRSCNSGNSNGHTYWTPLTYGDEKEDFSQAVLDTKALNCVPWYLVAALCAFDGGHLLKSNELTAAYTNNGTTAYPWGARRVYSTRTASDLAVQLWSYATPNPPANARREGENFLDIAYYIAPPGRRPAGYSAAGVTDLVGNLLEWVGDRERQLVWKGSWENHASEADGIEYPVDDDPYMVTRPPTNAPWIWNVEISQTEPNGYYGIGARCGY